MVRAAGAPVAPGRLEDLPDPTWRSILGRGLPQFAAEAVVPVLVFYGAWRAAGLAAGIAAGTIVSVALAVVLMRRGRDVALVAVGAAFVVVQAVVGLASHSTTVYLAQPVLLNVLWGVACFVSIAIRRPLIGVLAGRGIRSRPGSARAPRSAASSPCSRLSSASSTSRAQRCGCGRSSRQVSAASSSSPS